MADSTMSKSAAKILRRLFRAVVMAIVLAAVAGVGAGLFGVLWGAAFAVISGTLLTIVPAGIHCAFAGAVAGAIVGAFGTLVVGDPLEEPVPPRVERPEHAPGWRATPARTSTVRVWTEEEEEAGVFSTCPPDSSGEPSNRKERPWT
jgi:hypothetical protein